MKIPLIYLIALLPSISIAFAHTKSENSPHVTKVTDGLNKPTFLTAPKDTKDYLYILEKEGRIKLYDRAKKALIEKPFLDISSQIKIKMNEQGLLGMAFSPKFDEDKRFYLNYTNLEGDTVISRFTVKSANEIKEEKLLEFKQDFRNHNGGWIGFGPDGFLYIGTGDGGAGNDPKNRAQDVNSLLGKLLRIDVSGENGYKSPAGNYSETTKEEAKPEILAKGLRNPWRCAWDGDVLYLADVGQNAYEEINAVNLKVLAGADFGWRFREATHPNPNKKLAGDTPKAVEPVHEYARKDGFSITGGYVYRGKIESLHGQYFYADYVSNNIWSFILENGKATENKKWNEKFKTNDKPIKQISSFGKDPQGELYIISHNGSVFKIVK